jgi:NADPH-dependent 2,4-dienoyl-CoA reductase/sulfur reductase-like enzyme
MSNDTYVIVGAGHAARRAAETLRQKAPESRILMIGEEARPGTRGVPAVDGSGQGAGSCWSR